MLSSKDYYGALVVMSVVRVRLVCVLCVMFCACICFCCGFSSGLTLSLLC